MVSVIIPAYNCQKTIKACIDSIINQTYNDLEIIVVNDESKDDTLAILKTYNDTRLKILTKENIGAGAVSAYQVGLRNASAEYVTMVDSDDTIDENYIESLVNDLIKYDVDCVVSGYKNINGEKISIITNELSNGIYETNNVNIICNKAFSNQFSTYPVRWNKIYKRKYIEKFIDLLDPYLIQREDNVFCYLYFKFAKNFYVNNDNNGYNYCINPLSVTTKKDLAFWFKMLKSTNYLYELSNDITQCSRLMLDNVTNTISKSINDGVKYKEIKPVLKDMLDNPLVRNALKESKIYSLKEKSLMFIMKLKLKCFLFFIMKILKKLRK